MKKLQTVLDALEQWTDETPRCDLGALDAKIYEAIAIVKQMMQAEPVAWADAYAEASHFATSRTGAGKHRASLRAALTEALEQPADCNALMLVKDCLMQANEQVNGPIVDTIWFSQTETLFDYIDSALQTAQPVREPLPDAWIRERTKQPWVFETVKTWVREIEREHGIGVSK